jgi:hypothetical protein
MTLLVTAAQAATTVEQMQQHPHYEATFAAVQAWADEYGAIDPGSSGAGSSFPYGAYILSSVQGVPSLEQRFRVVFATHDVHRADLRDEFADPNEQTGCKNSLVDVAYDREIDHAPLPVIAFFYYCFDQGNSQVWSDRIQLLLPLGDERYVHYSLRAQRDRDIDAEDELARRIAEIDTFLDALGICSLQPQPGDTSCDGTAAPGASSSPTSAPPTDTLPMTSPTTSPASAGGTVERGGDGGLPVWPIVAVVVALLVVGGGFWWLRSRGASGAQPSPSSPPAVSPGQPPVGPPAEEWKVVQVKRPPGGS